MMERRDMTSSTGLEVNLTTAEEHQAAGQCPHSPSINRVQLKKQPFLGVFLKSCNVCFPFSLSRIDYLSQCSLESLPVCLSPEEGQCQPVCLKVLVKCKSFKYTTWKCRGVV